MTGPCVSIQGNNGLKGPGKECGESCHVRFRLSHALGREKPGAAARAFPASAALTQCALCGFQARPTPVQGSESAHSGDHLLPNLAFGSTSVLRSWLCFLSVEFYRVPHFCAHFRGHDARAKCFGGEEPPWLPAVSSAGGREWWTRLMTHKPRTSPGSLERPVSRSASWRGTRACPRVHGVCARAAAPAHPHRRADTVRSPCSGAWAPQPPPTLARLLVTLLQGQR